MTNGFTEEHLKVALGGVAGPPKLTTAQRLCRNTARLQVACQWMDEAGQWEAFTHRHPEAKSWLSEDGVPV